MPTEDHIEILELSFMRRCLYAYVSLCLTTALGFIRLHAQTPSQPLERRSDYAQEAFVTELGSTRITFEDDGTSKRELTARVRIQSEAGVQHFGVLTFSYQASTDAVDIDYVRVRKADGTVVFTPPENIQDMPAEITRQAPFYSDLREKHVSVKGLSAGDVLEYQCRWQSKPLARGQFWVAFNFSHGDIVLQEQLQISVPKDRPVKWHSADFKPAVTEQGARRLFTWTSSELKRKSPEEERKDKELTLYRAVRGKFPQPDIHLSSFQSWEDVGHWYNSLQEDRVKPTPEIRAKATEITKGITDDVARVHAIYSYVSTQFHYIGVAFGIGRIQPHAAAEVLANQYGDCKDKHTLLASLLSALGIKAYPVLIASIRDVDPDVPSPVQFDHMITVVPQGKDLFWLDTTPEVAPFRYLLSTLRDKLALVIPDDKPAALMTTPANPPSTGVETFQMQAKLDDKGTLEGRIERTFQGGDFEVLGRAAFRSVPATQWKDLVQQMSYATGFAGDVSDATVASPERFDHPLHFEYKYTRKDYPDWSNRRIAAPLPPFGLPPAPDQDIKPSYPIWLGAPAELHFQCSVELPKGYTPELPNKLDVKEDFAEYHASYGLREGLLTADRYLIVKQREVALNRYEAYRKFTKLVSDDHADYIALSTEGSPESYQDAIWRLPYSENREAARAYDEARELYNKHDLQGEIASLKRAVEIDPKFSRAWLWLGEIYKYARQTENAVQVYRKAIEIDPQQPVGYKALGYTLLSTRKFGEALSVWQTFMNVAPNDVAGPAGLGSAMLGLKRYAEAITAFEKALSVNPQLAGLQAELGSAYLLSRDADRAERAFQKAIELDSKPSMLNHVAYELANANAKLPLALHYAEKAVSQEEQSSRKVNLLELQADDLKHTASLAAFWDTLGWVQLRLGNLDEAEKYLEAAWLLGLDGVPAHHLGQVFERQQKKQAAIRMYRMALYCFSLQRFQGGEEADKTRQRLD